MDPMLVNMIIFVVIVVAIIVAIGYLVRWLSPYRYCDRNPARRWCKACGQREEFYVMAYAEGDVPVGWEVMYPLAENPCGKHRRMLKCEST